MANNLNKMAKIICNFKGVSFMKFFSICRAFKSAKSVDLIDDEDEEEGGDGSTWLSEWKYKRKRNGYKGRTPKHPLNKRPYTC